MSKDQKDQKDSKAVREMKKVTQILTTKPEESARYLSDLSDARRELYNSSPELVQKFAVRASSYFMANNHHSIGFRYDLGVVINAAADNPTEWGDNPYELMLQLVPELSSTHHIASMSRVAAVFARDYVTTKSAERTSIGTTLSWSHWTVISTLDSASDREAMVDRAIAEGLSIVDLKSAIASHDMARTHRRAGGRNPSVAASAQLLVQQAGKKLRTIRNYLAQAESTKLELDDDADGDMSVAFKGQLQEYVTELKDTEAQIKQARQVAETALSGLKKKKKDTKDDTKDDE